jgi:hypothetical protein
VSQVLFFVLVRSRSTPFELFEQHIRRFVTDQIVIARRQLPEAPSRQGIKEKNIPACFPYAANLSGFVEIYLGAGKSIAENYTILQGDHLARIAKAFGFSDWPTIWKHVARANAEGHYRSSSVLATDDSD